MLQVYTYKMEVPKIIVVLTLLYFIQTVATIKVSKKSHTLPRNSLRNFDREDGRLLYVACNPDYNRHEKTCQIVGEISVEGSDTYACNVTLTTSGKHEIIGPEVNIKRFGQAKAVLFWQANRMIDGVLSEQLYTVISVVQLETCNIAEIRLDYKSPLDDIFFVPYLHTFDMFFKHSKVCGKDMCKMTVNGKGEIIEGPVAHFRDHDEPYLLKSLTEYSSAGGYFYVKRTSNETIYLLINPDGSQKILSRFMGHPTIYTSTIHDWITACATYEGDKKYINCTQYDIKGQFEFETKLKKTNVDTQVKFVHNVREGGFFLAYFTSSSCQTIQTCIHNLNNLLAKFDAGGKQIGSKVEKKTSYIWDSMFENKEGDYCVFKNSFFADNYVKKDGKNRMRITHDCYNNNDFSQ